MQRCWWCRPTGGCAAPTTPTCSGDPRSCSRCSGEEGKTPILYVVGRKALSYYSFRNWNIAESWTGFSEKPTYENAQEIASTLVDAFNAGADDEGDDPGPDNILGVDELHLVFTEFKSMMSQTAVAQRIAPMEVEYLGEDIRTAHAVLVRAGCDNAVRDVAAAVRDHPNFRRVARVCGFGVGVASPRDEVGHRQRRRPHQDLTLQANRERQAQITQEISEIVGGANALAEAANRTRKKAKEGYDRNC